MRLFYFLGCGAALIYAAAYAAYCISKRMVADALSIGALIAATATAVIWLAAVS